MTFTSWPAIAFTEISGAFGIAGPPAGRRSRTTTACVPASRPRIATRNIRGCCAGKPVTLIFRKTPRMLSFPSCPTTAWSHSAASRMSGSVTFGHDVHVPIGHDDHLLDTCSPDRRDHLRAGQRRLLQPRFGGARRQLDPVAY